MNLLVERVTREFDLFCLDMMRTSRVNIFTKSEEIEVKKRISAELKEILGTVDDDNRIEYILALDHLIDSVYRFACERNDIDKMNADKIVKKWLENIQI